MKLWGLCVLTLLHPRAGSHLRSINEQCDLVMSLSHRSSKSQRLAIRPNFRTWPPPPHWKTGVGAGRPPARSVLGTESAARLRIFFQPLGEGFPPPYAPRRAPGRPHRYFFEREPVTLFERNFSNKVPCSILDLSLGPSRTQDKENSCRIASSQQP